MTDTQRTRDELLTLFADNTSGAISAQDGRDLIMTTTPIVIATANQINSTAALVASTELKWNVDSGYIYHYRMSVFTTSVGVTNSFYHGFTYPVGVQVFGVSPNDQNAVFEYDVDAAGVDITTVPNDDMWFQTSGYIIANATGLVTVTFQKGAGTSISIDKGSMVELFKQVAV